MSDSILNLILRLRKQGSGVKETKDELTGLQKASQDTKSGLGGMVNGLADVKAGFDMASQVIGYMGQALDATVVKAANWGDEMGDLAQLTGQSVEETSRMAATFELIGIKGGTLTKVLKTLSQDGINLNMKSLGDLARQYQALQDPVEKNRFLFQHFGKSAADMAEVMGRSSEELDRLANAAARSGKVIGVEAADAAEMFNVNMAILQQKAEGAGIAIGNLLIPVLNTAATSMDQLTQIWSYAGIEFAKNVGLIDQTTASAAEMKAFGIDPVTTSTEIMTVAISEATATNKDMADSADLAAAAQDRQRLATDANTLAAAALAGGMKDLTAETLFNQAAAGLDSVAALELARNMGLIDEEAAGAAVKVAELKNKYDANHDGAISAAEGAAQYAREVSALAHALDAVKDKTVTLTVKTVGGDFGQVVVGGDGGNQLNTRRASGGPVVMGQPYMVGERGPEMFVPRQSGTIIPNAGGGGDATAAMLQTLPATIARAVRDGMLQAVR